MATRTFTGGGGTGDVGTAGNWDTAPSAGDDLVFDRTSYDLYGDITGTGNMGNVYVTGGFKGRLIGTAATPLKIKLAASKTWAIASGPNLEMVHISAGASGAIPTLKINGPRAVTLSLAMTVTDLEFDNIGSLVVATDVTVTNYRGSRSRVYLDVLGTATGATLMELNSGVDCTTKRAMASSAAVRSDIKAGATLRVLDPGTCGSASASAGGVDKGVVYNDGYLNWRSGQTAPTVLIGNSGRLDYAGAEKDITIHSLRPWPDATVQRKAPGISVTISNELPVSNRA